jgi:hypothetical protein
MQMEKGMKAVPGSVATKERWIQIGAMVEGKAAKDCFERFKIICARLKADKEQ